MHVLFLDGPLAGSVDIVPDEYRRFVYRERHAPVWDARGNKSIPDEGHKWLYYISPIWKQSWTGAYKRAWVASIKLIPDQERLTATMERWLKASPLRWERPKLLEPGGVDKCCAYICHKLGIPDPLTEHEIRYFLGGDNPGVGYRF